MKAITEKAHRRIVKQLQAALSILRGESRTIVELENRRRAVVNAATAYARYCDLMDKGETVQSCVDERRMHLRGAVKYLIKSERAYKDSRKNQEDWLEEHVLDVMEEDDADSTRPLQQQPAEGGGQLGVPGLVGCEDTSTDRRRG